jgi:hypothetical protein
LEDVEVVPELSEVSPEPLVVEADPSQAENARTIANEANATIILFMSPSFLEFICFDFYL